MYAEFDITLVTGNEEIDGQHKEWIDRINKLYGYEKECIKKWSVGIGPDPVDIGCRCNESDNKRQ